MDRNLYWVFLLMALLGMSCSEANGNEANGNPDTATAVDGDADSDSDSDSNSDNNSDSDMGFDTNSDTTGGHPISLGDCTGDEECPPTGQCVSLDNSGQWQICATPVAEATGPTASGFMDECNTSDDCTAPAKCYYTVQGLGAFIEQNRCLADECQTDEDCPTAGWMICVPAGAYGYPVNTCVTTNCRSHADCTAAPQGTCLPYTSSCWGGFQGKYCHYPTDECLVDADCTGSTSGPQCIPQNGSGDFVCQMEMCPAR